MHMANEALAPASASPACALNEEEYQTFYAVLSASGRGRAFLAEYARRTRGADTEVLLAALARLEALMHLQRAGVEPLRIELCALLGAIRGARPEIEASALPMRAVKLAHVLDLLERRLEALVKPISLPAPGGEARLAVVPVPDEPELPIPSPSAAQPTLTLAHERVPPPVRQATAKGGSALIIPEVTWLDGPPPGSLNLEELGSAELPSMAEKVTTPTTQLKAPVMPPETPKPREFCAAEPAPPRIDPLMLLSEDERLALFT